MSVTTRGEHVVSCLGELHLEQSLKVRGKPIAFEEETMVIGPCVYLSCSIASTLSSFSMEKNIPVHLNTRARITSEGRRYLELLSKVLLRNILDNDTKILSSSSPYVLSSGTRGAFHDSGGQYFLTCCNRSAVCVYFLFPHAWVPLRCFLSVLDHPWTPRFLFCGRICESDTRASNSGHRFRWCPFEKPSSSQGR